MLVTGTDLNLWSNRRDAQSVLPQVVRRLIHATVGRILRIGFPAGEAVQMGGWDGVLVVDEGNAFVPDGQSVWELGTNRDVKGKADGDYEKRVADPLGVTPAETAFVFVTPRRWGGKDAWAAERQAEGIWREVRAYDAEDLEAWLELAPAVHVWLSILLGKQPEGATDLSSFWRDWSEATDPPLTPGLVISGRREATAKVLEWMREEPSVLTLRADSREEAQAILLAVLHELPVKERVALLARGAVVLDAAAWRRLSAGEDALLLATMFDDRGMVGGAVRHGHHVFVPLGRGDGGPATIELPRLSRDAAEAALAEMGISQDRTSGLATLARRSMMSLRRRLALSPALQAPTWASPGEAGELLGPMLAGMWNDSMEGDQEVLAALSRQPYDALGRVLHGEDFEERDRQVAELRVPALREVHECGGLPLLLELADRVEDPWAVGSTLGRSELLAAEEDELLRRCLAAENPAWANLAHGFVGGRFGSRGWAWIEEKLGTPGDALSPEQRAAFLVALPFGTVTWNRLEEVESETQRRYWRRVHPYAVQNAEEAERGSKKLLEYGRPFAAVSLLARYALAEASEIPPALIVDALEQAVQAEPGADSQRGAFAHHVGKLLRRLERTGAVDESRLAALEWAFLPLLSRRDQGPAILHRELARSPEFFAEIVSYVYLAEGEEGGAVPETELARARLGQELLDSWKALPGLREDGSIDDGQMAHWIATARELLAPRGRGAIGDTLIGHQLRYSPSDPDGVWPATPVRELIETLANEDVERGIMIEVLNSRGATWRSLTAGGAQEHALEEQYRGYAGAVGDRWPRTAAMLRRLADEYGRQARREDTSAELRADLWR